MKKKKYLPLYYRWFESGTIPENGLCNCFGNPLGPDDPNVIDEYKEFLLMFPDRDKQIKNGGYWATELSALDRQYTFCPLRQNIVLFLAAMNDEL